MGLSFQSQQRAVQCGAGGAAVDQLRGHVRVENWAESPTSEKRSGRLCSGGVGRESRKAAQASPRWCWATAPPILTSVV